MRRPPALLIAVVVVFVLAIVYLLVTSMIPRDAAQFDPDPPLPRAEGELPRVDTVTIAAANDRVWRYFDLETRSLLTPSDTAGWDVAFRRFNIMVSGAAADLGSESTFHDPRPSDVSYRPAADSILARWYSYNYLSHLLEPNGRLYALRTREGNEWVVEFLSYYCTGMAPGCVTLRYRGM